LAEKESCLEPPSSLTGAKKSKTTEGVAADTAETAALDEPEDDPPPVPIVLEIDWDDAKLLLDVIEDGVNAEEFVLIEFGCCEDLVSP